MELELTTGTDAYADCGGRLRRIGEDVTEELEYAPCEPRRVCRRLIDVNYTAMASVSSAA